MGMEGNSGAADYKLSKRLARECSRREVVRRHESRRAGSVVVHDARLTSRVGAGSDQLWMVEKKLFSESSTKGSRTKWGHSKGARRWERLSA